LPHANRILAGPVQLDGSSFRLPDGPGLGVTVDEQAVIDLSETT
jgi:L-alanine-DL-glutamate epimerase-like enolase superfamily enzyme